MLCWQDSELLAYQRCLPPGAHSGKLPGPHRRQPQARGQQLGRELVRRGIEHNLQRWPDSDIRINAQAHLQAFYAIWAFSQRGMSIDEDGIAHIADALSCARPDLGGSAFQQEGDGPVVDQADLHVGAEYAGRNRRWRLRSCTSSNRTSAPPLRGHAPRKARPQALAGIRRQGELGYQQHTPFDIRHTAIHTARSSAKTR